MMHLCGRPSPLPETSIASERRPFVTCELNDLQNHYSSLEDAVTELLKRLEPVVAQSSPAGTNEAGCDNSPPATPLCAELRAITDRLKVLRSCVVNVLGRLEI